MTTKHTPGPWSYMRHSGGDRFIIDGPHEFRAIAVTAGYEPENEANASLIAAAPDLLEALIAVRDAEVEGLAHIDIGAAIAKARGEA